jgi:putative DNA primase/helicase
VYADGSLIDRPRDVGTYQPYGEVEIERLGEEHLGGLFNTEFKNQVVRKLERRNHVRRREVSTPPERLVVSNGILDLTTGGVSEHTPEEYHQTRLDVAYQPDADCPRINEFLHQVVDRSDVATLYRFIAHALYQDYPEEKAVMLLGEGANGKSTFLHLVEQFLGDRNVSNQSLQDITERRFAPNLLRGKQANIHADMSDQNVDSLRMFKNLTGRDTVQADVKYESPVTFTNHATMFFACNDLPVLKDDTQGHWRRWALIWFTRSFSKSDDDYVPRRQLDRELTADSELEGLLARCVEEIKAWDAGRAWFPDVDGWKTTRRKMRKAAEPVFGFAETCLRRADGNLRKEDVRDAYAQYATEEGIAKMGREQFGRKLLNLPDLNIDAGQNRVNGDPQPTYQGIEFTSRGQQLLDKARGNLPEHGSLNGISSRKAVVDAFQDKPVTRDELAARTGLDDIDDVIERLHEDGTIIRLPTDGGEERYVLG